MSDGIDSVIKLLEDTEGQIQKLLDLPPVIMKDSGRMASAGDQLNERGSLKERLGKTDAEAMNIHRIEMAKRHMPTTEAKLTDAENDKIVDEMVNRIVDDMITKNIFR